MADWVWKGVYPKVFGRFHQLSLNKFFEPSTTPSIRNGRDGGVKKRGKWGGGVKFGCNVSFSKQVKLINSYIMVAGLKTITKNVFLFVFHS